MFWDRIKEMSGRNKSNANNDNIKNNAEIKNDGNNFDAKNNNGKKKNKKRMPGSFEGVKELTKMVFKERDLKLEKREITKEDKKAAIITAIIIIGIGLLLWFLPVTHQFFEDVIFLRI